jgi:hypothetical protein
MPGVYGDLRNLAQNNNFEQWNAATIVSTSNAALSDGWTTGIGTGSTYIASRASTGMDSGSFAVTINYTHSVVSDIHQVVGMLAELKGQTLSFSVKVATATARSCRPFISTDGGTTRTYGNYNTGAGATTYEVLKVEGLAVPTTATAIWVGLELRATAAIFIDSTALTLGSSADTAFAPAIGRSVAAWTHTSGSTVRVVDATATATSAMNIIRTLVMDLQSAGILQ